MDNITHTLIGALVGETVARCTSPDEHGLPAAARRNALVTLAAIGSNLPDSDLLYSFFGGKVNYLLQHRGHTHTLLIALLLGGLMLALTQWWMKRHGLTPSNRDLRWLWGVALFTPLLHIGMDFTNNYGVHPFWPIYNGWVYGDSVFIAEPLLWAACAPLAFVFRTRPARFAVIMVLIAAIALSFFSGLVPPQVGAIYSLIVAGMLLIGWRAPVRVALGVSVLMWIGVTTMFVLTGISVRHHVDTMAAQQFPQQSLLDRVTTPMPANPVCWEIMLLQREGDTAIARRAMFSLAPSVLPADRCLSRSFDDAAESPTGDIAVTAPLEPVERPDSASIKWYGQIGSSIGQLAQLSATDCRASAALRFIRLPWLAEVAGRELLGDLRYDRENAAGFAEIELGDGDRGCPLFVPPWIPPRQDLLDSVDAAPAAAVERSSRR